MTDRSLLRQELEEILDRNLELEQMIRSKGVQLSPVQFLTNRLNLLIDYVIGPVDDDPDSARVKWEIEGAKLVNTFLTSANQEIDAELRKLQLTHGVGETAQQLHLPR